MNSHLSKAEVTELRELSRSSSFRNESHRVLVEGFRSLAGAFRAGSNIEQVLTVNPNDERLIYLPSTSEIISVDGKTLERIATTTSPQDVVAICSMPKQDPSVLTNDLPIFVLDNVSDPGNVGTIIRSSVAFGVGAIVMIGGCDPYHPKVVRSSAGTIFGCPIIVAQEFELPSLFDSREIYCAAAGQDNQLSSLKMPNNAVVVFGSEAHGIITPYFQNNPATFSIHMAELCESLNVAMTATIVAHHLATAREG